MSDAEKRSITIPINLDDVKDPKDMTRDELMEYLSSIDDVEHKISLRLSDVSKRLSDVLISSSMMALDVLRERLDNLAQRIIDQDITADELVQLTEILKEAWIFQNAENADQYSLFTDEDQPQALSLQKDFIPILDGALSKDVMRISTKSAKMDNFTKTATIRQSSSSSITIERFDQMQGALSTSAKKILDTSLAFLGAMNYFRSSSKQPSLSVEIPLIEYGEANGYQLTPRTMGTQEEQEAEQRRVDERIRELKRSIKRDLTDLASITWTGTETKGKNKGDYSSMRIISSHSIRKGIITVNFDVEAARYFVNAYVMRWPTVLLKHDNRNPNAYVIGRKIAYHNGNDQNAAAGTNCTLSVSSLLAAAPEIQTIEELKARGQRNWKDKIKKPLESALNDNVSIGLLEKWEYRDPGTGTTYTPDTAQALTWVEYEHLMIDFIMRASDPAQEERRAAKEAAKAAAAAEQQAAEQQPTPKRKRGRPRKEKPAEK